VKAGVPQSIGAMVFDGLTDSCSGVPRAPAATGAIERLFQTTGLTERDVDLIEINEAFSCVTMAAMQSLELSHDAVNVNGSAVALDHRISTSGTCILVTLLKALEQRRTTVGVTAICIGGGEALAVADQPFHETTPLIITHPMHCRFLNFLVNWEIDLRATWSRPASTCRLYVQ
jgi:hypothetical protein